MRCEQCDRELARGDEYCEIDGHVLCPEHVMDWLEENRVGKDCFGEKVLLFDDTEWYEQEIPRQVRFHTKICTESIEYEDPRYEPEFWEER